MGGGLSECEVRVVHLGEHSVSVVWKGSGERGPQLRNLCHCRSVLHKRNSLAQVLVTRPPQLSLLAKKALLAAEKSRRRTKNASGGTE